MPKQIGVVSNYVPEEVVDNFGPHYRIMGNFESFSKLDVPVFTCSFVGDFVSAFNHQCFDFLSGIVIPCSCDSLYATNDLLHEGNGFVHRFIHPFDSTPEGVVYFIRQINNLIQYLVDFFSVTFDRERLSETIAYANSVRKTLRDIGFLISNKNKNIPYREFLSVVQYAMQHSFEESKDVLMERYTEFEDYDEYSNVIRKVMLVGPILDDFRILDVIERFEQTKVVCDNITNGWRYFEGGVNERREPIAALASYYLHRLHSPTFRNDARYLSTIKHAIQEFGVNSVIMVNQRGCEPHSLSAPSIARLCDRHQARFLQLDIEHGVVSLERIKLNIHSFLENL